MSPTGSPEPSASATERAGESPNESKITGVRLLPGRAPARSTYLADKLAALAAGLPWPAPALRTDGTPLYPPPVLHDWQPRFRGELPVWWCTRCTATAVDTQKPPAGGCRGRRHTNPKEN